MSETPGFRLALPRWLDSPWVPAIAAGTWILVCLLAGGWFFLRSIDPTVCPPEGEYVIFCRAQQADLLLGNLTRLGLVFLGGAVLLGIVAQRLLGARITQGETMKVATVPSGKRGQSMIEFALITPLFFFMLFGVVEFALMMFDVTTTRFAAGEAARVETQAGNSAPLCTEVAGCVALFGPSQYAAINIPSRTPCDTSCQTASPPTCNADCQAIVAIHRTAVGGDKLEKVNYIDVQLMQTVSGTQNLSTPPTAAGPCERFNLDGTLYSGSAGSCDNYDPETARNTTVGQMDYIQVNINFSYRWLTGLFASVAPSPTFNSKFIVRLEPEKF